MRLRPAPTTATIRRAKAEDRPAIEALWREVDLIHAHLQPGFFRAASGPPRPSSFVKNALRSEDEIVLVAIADRAAVGLLHAQLYDTPELPTLTPRRRVHVEDVVVTRAWRRRG